MARKRKRHKKSSFAKRATVPFVLVIGIGLLGLFSISLVKEGLRSWEIEQEISTLERDVDELHQEKDDLSSFLAKIQTSAWEEKEARTKLGLAKEGETVVLLPAKEFQVEAKTPINPQDAQRPLPNLIKWWYYFSHY